MELPTSPAPRRLEPLQPMQMHGTKIAVTVQEITGRRFTYTVAALRDGDEPTLGDLKRVVHEQHEGPEPDGQQLQLGGPDGPVLEDESLLLNDALDGSVVHLSSQDAVEGAERRAAREAERSQRRPRSLEGVITAQDIEGCWLLGMCFPIPVCGCAHRIPAEDAQAAAANAVARAAAEAEAEAGAEAGDGGKGGEKRPKKKKAEDEPVYLGDPDRYRDEGFCCLFGLPIPYSQTWTRTDANRFRHGTVSGTCPAMQFNQGCCGSRTGVGGFLSGPAQRGSLCAHGCMFSLCWSWSCKLCDETLPEERAAVFEKVEEDERRRRRQALG